jgi:hypothetical protein
VRRTTSGILALTAQGEWLDVKGVKAGDGTTVAVTRYRDAGLPGGLPSEISGALADRGMSSQGARVAAGADVGTAAVTEASKVASDAVVEAWLLERGQAFALSGRELVALADAGVPARVTDAMVAVSNPKAFSVARQDPRDRVGAGDDEVVGRRISVYLDPRGGPWSWGYSPYGYSPYGYSPYGYSPYGYSPYAYSPYGYYSPYGGYGAYAPVIVVNRPDAATAHGKLVKGRGYTRDEPAGSAASSTRAPAERPASSAGSSGSTRSDGSASSGSQSTGRTAKPRP